MSAITQSAVRQVQAAYADMGDNPTAVGLLRYALLAVEAAKTLHEAEADAARVARLGAEPPKTRQGVKRDRMREDVFAEKDYLASLSFEAASLAVRGVGAILVPADKHHSSSVSRQAFDAAVDARIAHDRVSALCEFLDRADINVESDEEF